MDKKNRRIIIGLWGILFSIIGLGENISSLWAGEVKKPPKAELIQIEDQVIQDRLRIILNISQPVEYKSFTMINPPRLVLDLKPCLLGPLENFTLKNPSIAGVRFSQFNPKTVRVVFDFFQPLPYNLSHKKGTPYQVIVDFPTIKSQNNPPVSKKSAEDSLPKASLEDLKKEKATRENPGKEKRTNPDKEKSPLPRENLLSFDFYMANLHNVFRVIGNEAGKNIVVGDDVKDKKITLSLKEVTFEKAMDIIVEASNLKMVPPLRGENIYLVTTKEHANKIFEDENKRKQEEMRRRLDEEKLAQEKEKLAQEKLRTEELRHKTGTMELEEEYFQIKNVDVKLVEDYILGIKKTLTDETQIQVQLMEIQARGGQPQPPTKPPAGLSPYAHITRIDHTNTLVVRGTKKDIEYIGKLIKKIDHPVSQVMIEARIVEADANFTRDLGLRWGGGVAFGNTQGPFAGTVRGGDAGASSSNPTNNYAINLPLASTSTAFGGLGFAFASTNFNLDVRIQAMEQQGRGKTISSPKIMTLDNKKAYITQGAKIPVTTRTENNTFSTIYRDASLKLTVTPHTSSSKKIRIEVKVEKNEPDFTKVDSLGNPTIKVKEAETEMLVDEGDTVVIGGILFKKETFQENRIPLLGDIPILGWLFKTRNKKTEDTELLIFLTPKVQRPSLPGRYEKDS